MRKTAVFPGLGRDPQEPRRQVPPSPLPKTIKGKIKDKCSAASNGARPLSSLSKVDARDHRVSHPRKLPPRPSAGPGPRPRILRGANGLSRRWWVGLPDPQQGRTANLKEANSPRAGRHCLVPLGGAGLRDAATGRLLGEFDDPTATSVEYDYSNVGGPLQEDLKGKGTPVVRGGTGKSGPDHTRRGPASGSATRWIRTGEPLLPQHGGPRPTQGRPPATKWFARGKAPGPHGRPTDEDDRRDRGRRRDRAAREGDGRRIQGETGGKPMMLAPCPCPCASVSDGGTRPRCAGGAQHVTACPAGDAIRKELPRSSFPGPTNRQGPGGDRGGGRG